MDKGKKPGDSGGSNKSNKKYRDLREIIKKEALCYLPAKSLHRLAAVCRDWKHQISTPFFIHSQSYSFRSISGLFCQPSGGPPCFISLDPTSYGVPDPELKFLPEPVDIRASSNGLLCCQARTKEKAYYICNPVNQQWKRLPKPEADHGSDPAIVLVFDPKLLSFMADYKLVCAFPSSDFEDAYEFEIYSSTEDSWKVSPEICFGHHGGALQRGGVHLNDVVYWLFEDNYVLIAFDLKKGRSQIIPCYDLYGCLGVVDGKLYAVSKNGTEINVSVLVNVYANTMHMKARTETWKIMHRIQLDSSSGDHDRFTGLEYNFDQSVLGVGRDVVVFHDGGAIFSYDLRTKETSSLCTDVDFGNSFVCVPYVNSLVSLL